MNSYFGITPDRLPKILVYKPKAVEPVWLMPLYNENGQGRMLIVVGNRDDMHEQNKANTFESSIIFRPERSNPFITKQLVIGLPQPVFLLYEGSFAGKEDCIGIASENGFEAKQPGGFTEENLLPLMEESLKIGNEIARERRRMLEARQNLLADEATGKKPREEPKFKWPHEATREIYNLLSHLDSDERADAAEEYLRKNDKLAENATFDELMERFEAELERRNAISKRMTGRQKAKPDADRARKV